MLRLLTTPLACVLLVSCLAIGFGAAPVQASFITAYPNPEAESWGVSGGFSLQYTDYDHDGSFSLDELVPGSFSGVMLMGLVYEGTPGAGGQQVIRPVFVPYIAHAPPYCDAEHRDITRTNLRSDGPYYDGPYKHTNDSLWVFTIFADPSLAYPDATESYFVGDDPVWGALFEIGSWVYMPGLWSYTQSPAPVPLPPSVLLLGAGLIGLAVARRKKRSGP